ncbi:OmpA family protein [Altererythrobacter soli]|uniref:OmpA family protein n=1 Tax=Croceibacterium soli TaxID=1739690 RepID=A0A6I4UV21_9SPHN|nr:OmpA family protein [Croceibacterium soli]MXP41609.1 OmpA family protein [Croceibacterium soli]
MRIRLALPVMATCLAAALPGVAQAQANTDGLAGADVGTLRSEIGQRYDAALAATLDPSVVNADDSRFTWASEAKVQCGIALGFLKSGTRDQTSIAKCQMASDLMTRQPAPQQAAPPPPPPLSTQACRGDLPGMVFFDFDSAVPPADAGQTADFVARNAGPCGWSSFTLTGHADRSGSEAYNIDLSRRRAEAVASVLASAGLPRASITTDAKGEQQPRVPTADGVREPQNRRVEITVR